MAYYTTYNSPIGKIFIVENNGFISTVSFCDNTIKNIPQKITPLLNNACSQLEEYFCHKRTSFNIPILPQGTPFQQSIWKELLNIPYGKTQTYLEIASKLYSPKYCRAVGFANNKNPIAIIVPCHRVIGSNGKLIGYAGGTHIKQFLLNLERNFNA